MVNMVLSVIGEDRPGLLSELSEVVTACGGNWLESAMTTLSGTFAGAVLVDIPQERAQELEERAGQLEGLTVTIAPTEVPPAADGEFYELYVVGNDQPGIVAQITRAVKSSGGSIHEMQTQRREAPMDAGMLFEAMALVELPTDVDEEKLRASLESVAAELQVDIELADLEVDDEEPAEA